MICHPNAIIELSIMRGEELQAESERYGHAAQARSHSRRRIHPLVSMQTVFASLLIALKSPRRNLGDPEMVLDALARMDPTTYR
jgi:hypothetical protein